MSLTHFPLSAGEQQMKEVYQKNKELLSRPFYDSELHKWSCEHDVLALTEGYDLNSFGVERYFYSLVQKNPMYNAWVVDHPRYFPAVLHSMSFIKIIYVHHGSASLYLKESMLSLEPGDACFIAPKTIHSVGVFDDDALTMNVILKQSVLKDCFSMLLNRDDVLSHFFISSMYSESMAPAIIFHTGNNRTIQYYFEQMFSEFRSQYDSYTCNILEASLMMLFGLLLRNHSQSMSVINTYTHQEDPMIMECVRYLQSNYATTSLKEMSNIFHYSSSHLCRIIKQYTGTSFSQYTRDRKLENARDLLLKSEKAIKDIAEESGFSDISNFYRSFRTKYGITPLECRSRRALEQQS